MKLAKIHNNLQQAFFRQGWLLPTLLPVTQLGGRGLFNTLASLYALWGLLSLWGHRQRLDGTTTLLYLALLGVFLLGIPGSLHPNDGFKVWLGFLAPSLAVLLVQVALWESVEALDRLLGSLALFGGLLLAGLYLLLPHYGLELSGVGFDPDAQLREDDLPFILPFLLAWIWQRGESRGRYWAMLGITAAVLAYIVLSEGRAALVGALLALVVFGKIVLAWRWRSIVALTALVLVAAISVHTGPFRKTSLDPEHPLDAFTAGRTALWRQALNHPPERFWLGVGLGNGRYASEVLRFQLGELQLQVRHLHNFLMDAWYETGLLGVTVLTTLIMAVFWRVAWRWPYWTIQNRQRAGILLAAALAILGSAMLSFSYTSHHFTYLFICLGALIYLSDPLREQAPKSP
jgi:O-antigen ligase